MDDFLRTKNARFSRWLHPDKSIFVASSSFSTFYAFWGYLGQFGRGYVGQLIKQQMQHWGQ